MYFELSITNEYKLVMPELSMAHEIYNLVDSDREHLHPFLDFVDSSIDVTSQIDYFKMKMNGLAKGTDKLFFIAKGNKLIGCIDLHNIDSNSKKAEIGYWIHSNFTGKNITTQAVRILCDYSFTVLDLNKLIILADVENIASNKVAIKSGFKLLGIRYQDDIRYDKYRDTNEYYLLKSDFI